MDTMYETLRARYGVSAKKKVAEPEIAVEEAEKDELELLFSPKIEEVLAEGTPTGTENKQALEKNSPNEVVESPELRKEIELHVYLEKQREALAALEHYMVLLDQKVTAFGANLEQMQQTLSQEVASTPLVAKLEELRQASIKQEKANVDILRDSKNFQASVREQMQRELDCYRKMHTEAANAPILTAIANLYNMSYTAIGFLTDAKERKNISEIVLEGLLEILEEQGVTVNSTPAGGKRPVKTCKTRKTIPTGDPELHGMVAESITPSFTLGNQVLIKECIDTYVYDASLDLPKGDSEMPTEKVNANQDEPSAAPDVSPPDETKDIPDESLTSEGLLEGNGSMEEALSESATCIDEGAIETDTLAECNK